MKKARFGITDTALVLVSAVFLLGILFVFSPCGPTEAGSWMSCHWAGNAVTSLAVVLTVLSLAHLALSDGRMKMGIAISMIPVSALTCLMPGKVIGLCMMNTMRCRAVMAPATVACGAVMMVLAVADIIVQKKRCKT